MIRLELRRPCGAAAQSLLATRFSAKSGAVPYRPCLTERLDVADQDRGIHERDEMRARASGEGDRLGERERQVRAPGDLADGLVVRGARCPADLRSVPAMLVMRAPPPR
jgi:hypothetical protein